MTVSVDYIRNFAIAGHGGSGKTTLVEQMLKKSGKINRLGTVEQKNTVSDYREDEQEKQHSIYSTTLNCHWDNHRFHFIDTPGAADFLGDTTAALNICDTVLLVVDAVSGLQIGTARAWKLAAKRNCPRAFFINGLDRENANFQEVVDSIRETYGATTCIPVTLPSGSTTNLNGVVSVLNNGNAPAELADLIEEYKGALMDAVAESDEELMMRYLEGEELTAEEISKGLCAAMSAGGLIPIFAGSAAKDIGIAELMNGIKDLFPRPLSQGSVPMANDSELKLVADGSGIGFVFKSIVDPFIGQLTFCRVYSGVFKGEGDAVNITKDTKERFGNLLSLCGKEQTVVSEALPGEIFAVAKLRQTSINDTLAMQQTSQQFLPIEFPRPPMYYACYAVKRGDEDKIFTSLNRLADEDRTIKVAREPQTYEMLLFGLGDQHIDVIVNRLKASAKVEVDLRTPKVPYRETITSVGTARYRHKKQSGGHGQFAEVQLRVEPSPDVEFEFSNQVVGGNIPKNYIPSVEKGVVMAMERGPLAGCKVINVKAVVFDGKEHPVDSSDMAFQIASRGAFREALGTAKPILLEPIMQVKVSFPDQYMGDISGDLNSRRGRILGMDREEGLQVVNAEVPLAETFSYSSQLRSITQGCGSFEMEFLRYDQVPAAVSKQIQAAAEAAKEEE